MLSIPAFVTPVQEFGNRDSGRKETASKSITYLFYPIKPAAHSLRGKGLTGQTRYLWGQSSEFKVVSVKPERWFHVARAGGFVAPVYVEMLGKGRVLCV